MGLDRHEGSVGGFFFLGLELLDCVQILFGVKMKENKRRFWIGGSVCVVIVVCDDGIVCVCVCVDRWIGVSLVCVCVAPCVEIGARG